MAITTQYNDTQVTFKFEPAETHSEPIYPDLIDITIDPEIYYEIIDNIDEKDRLESEKPGQSYVVTAQEAIQKGIQIGKLSFTYEDYKDREAGFDPSSRRYAGKAINTGKPLNNNDPFPVDEKIQELEEHLPRIKIQELSLSDPSSGLISLTQSVMDMSDKIERRFAKVENNLSTVTRNLFRTASRMNINCVYYGGQSEYRKYNTIRCLHHDRVADGQLMSLDQCLNCTRYEPIAGKVYDILDETGKSLNLILDDNQMAYKNMKEYLDATRVERYHDPLEHAILETKDLEFRKEGELDFKDLWPEGFKMGWDLTPIEVQIPHINYEDKSESKTLKSSYKNLETTQYASSGFYTQLESNQGTMSIIRHNDAAFEKVTDPKLIKYIDNGKAYAKSSTDSALKRMAEGGYEKFLRETCKKENVDPILILAIIVAESGGQITPKDDARTKYNGLMQNDVANLPKNYKSMPETEKARINIEIGVKHYKSKLAASWKTANDMLGLTAFNSGEGTLRGVSSKGVKPIYETGLNLDQKESWTWVDISKNLERNAAKLWGDKAVFEKMTYYPRIHFIYKFLVEKKGYSPLSGRLGITFPYSPETIKNKKIYFVSDFVMRHYAKEDEMRMHYGLDFMSEPGTPICSAGDGVVESIEWYPQGAGQVVTINHGTNLYTLYMHLQKGSPGKNKIVKGAKVKVGQVIGNEGNSGSQDDKTGYHLHFEVRVGGNTTKHSVDPKKEALPWMSGIKADKESAMAIPI